MTSSPRSPRSTNADVVIVGGGITGWSAAYFAAMAGRRVTLVDDGAGRASDLPVALVNPLRGATGRLVAGGVDGMHATFALVDRLRADGHPVVHGRGLWRPLIGVPPAALARAHWTGVLADRMAFDWHDVAPASLGLATDVPALFLPDAGWVAPRTLLDALAAASGATVLAGRVDRVDAHAAVLADGSTLDARTMLWCGGAWGAASLDAAADAAEATAADSPDSLDALTPADVAAYKPGSLVEVDAALTAGVLSFGLYAAPHARIVDGVRRTMTLVGPTREGTSPRFATGNAPVEAVRHLGDRIARVFGATIEPREAWRGVRLARLPATARDALAGVPTLTALGSRGFLMAPLIAERWARSL